VVALTVRRNRQNLNRQALTVRQNRRKSQAVVARQSQAVATKGNLR